MEDTSQDQTRVTELEEDDDPPVIYTPGESIDETQQILTQEMRNQILGRVAEFEIMLASFNEKRQNFVLAVLQNPSNITACARKAGFAEASAKVKASQLMADSRIQHCIALGQQLREDRTMVTSERTLNELAIIAYSNITDYEVLPGTNTVKVREGVPEYALRAISTAEYTTTVSESGDRVTTTYKTKLKLWSKTDALRMLATYQKLLTGEGGGNTFVDNSKHLHQHQHNVWQIGDRRLEF